MPDGTILLILGMILIMLGFFLLAAGMMRSAKESVEVDKSSPYNEIKEAKVKGGGVILIGPIPVVFGSDKRYALLLVILAVVLMLIVILFLR